MSIRFRASSALHILTAVLVASLATAASAASLLVLATDRDGKPLADAVITVHVPNAALKPAGKPQVVSQESFAFKPFMTVVPVGSQLSFPNRDRVAHHLRALSQEYRFEFTVYAPGKTPAPVTLDKPGTIELNCLIHTSMRGYVRVVDTPFVALTDEHGVARIDAVPEGKYEVRGWHPDLILEGPRVATSFGAAPINLPMQFQMRPKPRPKGDGY